MKRFPNLHVGRHSGEVEATGAPTTATANSSNATIGVVPKKRNRRKSVYYKTHTDVDYEPPLHHQLTTAASVSAGLRRGSIAVDAAATVRAAAATAGRRQSTGPMPMRSSSGRVKKARVPFDPSEENFPRRRRTGPEPPEKPAARDAAPTPPPREFTNGELSPSSSSSSSSPPPPPPPVSVKAHKNGVDGGAAVTLVQKLDTPMSDCGLCMTADRRPFSVCTQCKVQRVHVDCYKADSRFYAPSEAQGWQCENCRTCTSCYETSIIGTIYKCFVCKCYYHAECNQLQGRPVQPPVVHRTNRIRCAQCEHYSEQKMKRELQKIAATIQSKAAEERTQQQQQQQPKPQQQQQPNPTAKSAQMEVVQTPPPPPAQVKPQPVAAVVDSSADVVAPRKPAKRKSTPGFAGFTKTEVQRTRRRVVTEDVDDAPQSPAIAESNGFLRIVSVTSGAEALADSLTSTAPPLTASNAMMDITMTIDEPSRPSSPTTQLPTLLSAAIASPASPSSPASEVAAANDDATIVNRSITEHRTRKCDKHAPSKQPPSTIGWSPFDADGAVVLADEVPDASHWSAAEVHAYFARHFRDADAMVMLIEEIDGSALLLLKRHDVLKLPLRLGVALNMYIHIVRLQTRSNDVRKSFNE